MMVLQTMRFKMFLAKSRHEFRKFNPFLALSCLKNMHKTTPFTIDSDLQTIPALLGEGL